MKIIFLDIDGVLNSHTTVEKCGPYPGLDHNNLNNLKKIVDSTGAVIYLISSWGYYWHKEPKLKKRQDDLANYLDATFEKYGLKIENRLIDDFIIERGKLIRHFIKNASVETFIIIDDHVQDYESAGLLPHLVKTSYYKGGLNIVKTAECLAKLQ